MDPSPPLPSDPAALLRLGISLQNSGQHQAAAGAYGRCTELAPSNVEAWARLATIRQALGENGPAIAAFRRALELAPGFAALACNLGGLLLATNQPFEAMRAFEQAIAADPGLPEAHNGLGIAFKDTGRFELAVAAFNRAIALRPTYFEALFNLGNTLNTLSRWTEAMEAYNRARAAGPASADLLNNLGVVLWNLRRFDDATICHRQALSLAPALAEAWNNLGNDLLALHRFDESEAAFRQASSLRPGYSQALCNIGNVHLARNDPDAAIAAFRAAGDFPEARYNEALAQLLKGDFTAGFRNYEWRWQATGGDLKARSFAGKPWKGEPLAGREILVYSEQGLGDTIQFIRFVPELARRGGRVTLCVQQALVGLLQGSGGAVKVMAAKDAPSFADYHCSLLSLPGLLGTNLDNLPHDIPYVRARPESAAATTELLRRSSYPKIGVVCSGNPRHRNDHNRSVPISSFLPLAEQLKQPFFVVQKEVAAADDALMHSRPDAFLSLAGRLESFDDTAAAIEALDLLITVDTSLAHLAGAMGKPVWTLLPFAPDWRWMLVREDSPWYPTMRLFRQPSPGDWPSVFQRLGDELTKFRSE